MVNKFKEKFDIRKLELYLSQTDRGFILLLVNDRYYQNEIIDNIYNMKNAILYSLKEREFRDVVKEIKESNSIETVMFYDFPKEEMIFYSMMEKINLSRDLLLECKKHFIFIVPQYIGDIIQNNFQNLYSYFILKENYISEIETPFEYIMPDRTYLITKDMQHEMKKEFLESNNIDKKLEYYMYAKVNKGSLTIFLEEIKKHIIAISEKKEGYDIRYGYLLWVKLAKVLSTQNMFKEAIEWYGKILKDNDIKENYTSLYYDALLGKGDVHFQSEDYEKAKEEYMNAVILIADNCDYDYDYEKVFFKYKVELYQRIAICFVKMGDYKSAIKYMDIIVGALQEGYVTSIQDSFSVYYNYCLLSMESKNSYEYSVKEMLLKLKSEIQCEVQEAMYHMVSAWYYGIVCGKLEEGVHLAKKALAIKRDIYRENDFRIAESHYIISILYMLLGDYVQAEHCCSQCINVLKNFNYKNRQNKLAKDLLMYIRDIQ